MFDVEILILARYFGMTIHEVPIRWRDDGDSRLQLVSGSLQNIKDILRIRLNFKPTPKRKRRQVSLQAGTRR
jgi:dolichyl-phosphate beta-glucosyltransferase